MVTQDLVKYNYNFVFPYVTISAASGQWFITAVWEKYFRQLKTRNGLTRSDLQRVGSDEDGVVRIMMDTRVQTLPGQGKWVFFTQERGGTWEGWDNEVFGWVGDNFVFLIFGLFVLLVGVWFCCCRGRKGRYRRVRVDEEEDGKGEA